MYSIRRKKEHEIADVCSEINARQMLKKCAPKKKNGKRGVICIK